MIHCTLVTEWKPAGFVRSVSFVCFTFCIEIKRIVRSVTLHFTLEILSELIGIMKITSFLPDSVVDCVAEVFNVVGGVVVGIIVADVFSDEVPTVGSREVAPTWAHLKQ